MKRKKSVPYDDGLIRRLKDPEIAAHYLSDCFNDESDERDAILLTAIQMIAKARGLDLAGIAHSADISRENLYRALAKYGNPKVKTLVAVLDKLDMRLSVTPKRKIG